MQLINVSVHPAAGGVMSGSHCARNLEPDARAPPAKKRL
jgi:hypothetical protein